MVKNTKISKNLKVIFFKKKLILKKKIAKEKKCYLIFFFYIRKTRFDQRFQISGGIP